MSQSAYEALLHLATLSRKSAKGLPEQIDSAPRWSGIGFSIMGERFVSGMGEVAELMEVPGSTRLPGVQPWVVGLANVRGRLLPLFDLATFFGTTASPQKKAHRVLVLETDTLYSGLVVDAAFGMQHFTVEDFSQYEGELDGEVRGFIDGAYTDASGTSWALFSMAKLAEYTKFIDASLVA